MNRKVVLKADRAKKFLGHLWRPSRRSIKEPGRRVVLKAHPANWFPGQFKSRSHWKLLKRGHCAAEAGRKPCSKLQIKKPEALVVSLRICSLSIAQSIFMMIVLAMFR